MKIIFVCTGNMSRSPFAECVLRQMLHERGIEGVEVSSVGTSYLEQSPRDPMMVEMAAKYGYQMGGIAVYMTPEELNSADVVLIMSRNHYNRVTSTLTSSHWDRIHLFLDYCCGIDEDVPDPYFVRSRSTVACASRLSQPAAHLPIKFLLGNWITKIIIKVQYIA